MGWAAFLFPIIFIKDETERERLLLHSWMLAVLFRKPSSFRDKSQGLLLLVGSNISFAYPSLIVFLKDVKKCFFYQSNQVWMQHCFLLLFNFASPVDVKAECPFCIRRRHNSKWRENVTRQDKEGPGESSSIRTKPNRKRKKKKGRMCLVKLSYN